MDKREKERKEDKDSSTSSNIDSQSIVLIELFRPESI